MCSTGRVEAVLNGVADVNTAVARTARTIAVFSLRACCLMEPMLMVVGVVLLFVGRYSDGGDNVDDLDRAARLLS